VLRTYHSNKMGRATSTSGGLVASTLPRRRELLLTFFSKHYSLPVPALRHGSCSRPLCTKRPGAWPARAVQGGHPQGTNQSLAAVPGIVLLASQHGDACNVTGAQMPIPVYTLKRTPDMAQTAARESDRFGSLPCVALILFHKAVIFPQTLVPMQEHKCMFPPLPVLKHMTAASPLS
jgi:hypothetical protein